MEFEVAYSNKGDIFTMKKEEGESGIRHSIRVNFIMERMKTFDYNLLERYSKVYADTVLHGIVYPEPIKKQLDILIGNKESTSEDDHQSSDDEKVENLSFYTENRIIDEIDQKTIKTNNDITISVLGDRSSFHSVESLEDLQASEINMVSTDDEVSDEDVKSTSLKISVTTKDGEEVEIKTCGNIDCTEGADVLVVNSAEDDEEIVEIIRKKSTSDLIQQSVESDAEEDVQSEPEQEDEEEKEEEVPEIVEEEIPEPVPETELEQKSEEEKEDEVPDIVEEEIPEEEEKSQTFAEKFAHLVGDKDAINKYFLENRDTMTPEENMFFVEKFEPETEVSPFLVGKEEEKEEEDTPPQSPSTNPKTMIIEESDDEDEDSRFGVSEEKTEEEKVETPEVVEEVKSEPIPEDIPEKKEDIVEEMKEQVEPVIGNNNDDKNIVLEKIQEYKNGGIDIFSLKSEVRTVIYKEIPSTLTEEFGKENLILALESYDDKFFDGYTKRNLKYDIVWNQNLKNPISLDISTIEGSDVSLYTLELSKPIFMSLKGNQNVFGIIAGTQIESVLLCIESFLLNILHDYLELDISLEEFSKSIFGHLNDKISFADTDLTQKLSGDIRETINEKINNGESVTVKLKGLEGEWKVLTARPKEFVKLEEFLGEEEERAYGNITHINGVEV